ncbi:von Willebrand factor A domain-containing protein 3B [Clonorchis sinensis]|uniref:von Willebrand factor A domain-containing protein 3B n=1 Tax=Clonorchis sinensis TaxID=79923 RepID=G7YJV5_CLOSI|nr:von Willebrand factor A domain-containing protein 3B [Clonorchis sinensis]
MRCPLHIVAYGCTDVDSLKLLSSLSKATGGRFHAYAPQGCLLDYSASPVDSTNPEARLTASEVVYGGTPEGWPQREDCMRIFEELEEARSTLNQIQRVIEAVDKGLPVHIEVPCTEDDYTRSLHSSPPTNKQEEQMSSKQWLQRHGLGAQRLDLFDVLAQASFRHCDGMVDILRPPTDEESHRSEKNQIKAFRHNELLAERLTAPLVPSAIIHPKHIDACYCDQFAHIIWKDGQVVHVQVTPEHYRLYARRVQANLTAIQKRIDWLCRGSRELFGTITEDNVCIVIDTSTSMSPSINFVKQKLLLLLEEQLKYRKKMNFIAYSDRVMAWSEYCLDTTAENIISAANWAKSLTCGGSTNTLAALQFALSDTQIEGIYLLTDGRPDQAPRTILLKMHLQSRIPIHAISFNCQDPEANQFLLDLAKESGGRFQYFTLTKKAPETADQWESEDIRLLRAEYRLGLRSLERMAELRDECRRLAKESALIQRKRKRTSEPSRLKKSDESELLPRVGQHVWKIAKPSSPRKTGPKPDTMKFDSPGTTNVADGYQYKGKTDSEMTGSSRQAERGHTAPEQIKPAQLGKMPRQENKAGTDVTSTRKLQPDYEGKEHVTLFRTKDIFDKLDLKEASHSKENIRGKQGSRQFKDPEKDKPIDIPSWIARYGLRPLKLRLIDLLSPVAVPLRPSYIPSLRHNIISNVLLETLPVAFISPSKRSESEVVHVFNPLAVDYNSYEKALTAALARIERKLTEVIARYLSDDGVKSLVERSAIKQGLTWQTQLCWYQYKDAIIQAFENEQWPIAKKDFYILANELDKGGQDYLEAKKLKRFGRTSTQQSPSIFRQPCGHKSPKPLQ